MHLSASNQIVDYLTAFEWYVPWMYLDSTGLVTTGIGNLLDPYSKFGKKVSFYRRSDGGRATDAEVKTEFDLVKSKVLPGGGAPQGPFKDYKAFESATNLRASRDDVIAAVRTALRAKEAEAVQYFGRDFDTFPADVQVVLVQMSYAGGLQARHIHLAPLLKKRDFVAARDYTFLSNKKQGRDGYKKYNAAFRMLMMNGWILEQCSKQSMLNWAPTDITTFYGFKRGLQLARWYTGDDPSLDVYEDDVVTERNYEHWLSQQV